MGGRNPWRPGSIYTLDSQANAEALNHCAHVGPTVTPSVAAGARERFFSWGGANMLICLVIAKI